MFVWSMKKGEGREQHCMRGSFTWVDDIVQAQEEGGFSPRQITLYVI